MQEIRPSSAVVTRDLTEEHSASGHLWMSEQMAVCSEPYGFVFPQWLLSPSFLAPALVIVAALPSHSADIVRLYGDGHSCFMLWRFLCNVCHLIFIFRTCLVRMLVGLPIFGYSKTAEYEFAVLTAVQLRMSESLNVMPCSLMLPVVSKDCLQADTDVVAS